MGKLYYRYGTVGSAKTMNMLAVAHNYKMQGKKILLCKPSIDTRFGQKVIKSRCGLSTEADLLIAPGIPIDVAKIKEAAPDCILVDESQFLSAVHIDQFRWIVDEYKIPIICYGLKADFRRQLFVGSKRLLEVADSIEEVKTTCMFCNKKGTQNLRLLGGEATLSGAQITLGCEETYVPCCHIHFAAKTSCLPEYNHVPLKRNQYLLEEKMNGLKSKITQTSPKKLPKSKTIKEIYGSNGSKTNMMNIDS